MNTRNNFRITHTFLLLLLLTCNIIHGQNKSSTQNGLLNIRLQQQANIMGQAFIKGDYQTFAKYTYPSLLTAMGGESRMSATLTQTINNMQSKGMSFISINVDSPSKIIKSNNELQCTLQQHTTIKVTNGRVVATSTLIALSEDGGKHWFFVDTSNKDAATMKKIMPNLSKDIIIPPQSQPVFSRF